MKPAVLESGRTRYVVQEFLTEGGMGAIYLGRRHDGAGNVDEVILKALLPELTAEPSLVELFLREARLTASLAHPNIVRTLDLVAGQGTYFIVMEYVVGADLRTLERRARRRRRQLAPPLALHVGLSMLEALDYAHRRLTPDGQPLGLIHRDISPSNILVDGDGRARLSDFGIAKLGTHRSTFHSVKGKLGYMAPEQARGETVDVRTDLFALGICLHEWLVGERLYGHAAASPTVTSVYAHAPARPSERRPELPVELDLILEKALSLDPHARYQSAAEMRADLARVTERHGLGWTDAEVAAHLREACGDDPRQWLRGEATAPPHHTEAYASGGDDDDDARHRHPHQTKVVEGTALTSLLDGAGAPMGPSSRVAAESLDALTPSPDRVATRAALPLPQPSSLWADDLTSVAFDGEATRIKPHSPRPAETAGRQGPSGPRERHTGRMRAEPTVPLQTLARESPAPSVASSLAPSSAPSVALSASLSMAPVREPDTAMQSAPPAGLIDQLGTLELSGRPLLSALGGATLLGLLVGLIIGWLLGRAGT